MLTINVMVFVQVSPVEEKQIQEQIGEDPRQLEKGVDVIAEWLRQQPHLPDDIEREILVTYIRGCNFSLEKAKKKLDTLFTMRAAAPEFCLNRSPTSEDLNLFHSLMYTIPLPGIAPGGHLVFLSGFHKSFSPSTKETNAIAKGFLNSIDISALKQPIKVGDILVLDAKELKLDLTMGGALAQKKKFLTFMEKAYPNKVKQVHVINVSPIVEKCVNVIKQWLSEKIRNRLFFHACGNYNDLYNNVPKHMLPDQLGGTAGDLNKMIQQYKNFTYELKDYLERLESLKADESKRPGIPRTHSEIFGIEGSFRQLALD